MVVGSDGFVDTMLMLSISVDTGTSKHRWRLAYSITGVATHKQIAAPQPLKTLPCLILLMKSNVPLIKWNV